MNKYRDLNEFSRQESRQWEDQKTRIDFQDWVIRQNLKLMEFRGVTQT